MKNVSTKHFPVDRSGGFTLVEVMVAMSVLLIVISGAFSIFLMHQRMAMTTTNIIDGSRQLSGAMTKMVYGDNRFASLREVYSEEVTLDQYDDGSWWLKFISPSHQNEQWLRYQANQDRLRRKGGSKWWLLENVHDSTATLKNGGIEIMVEVINDNGGITRTNKMSTFVKFRNDKPNLATSGT